MYSFAPSWKISCVLVMFLVTGTLMACSKSSAFLAEGAASSPENSWNAGDDVQADDRSLTACWQPLARRLAADGLHGPEVDRLLRSLGQQPSQSPMGRKIRELYKSQILQQKAKVVRRRHYKGVVSAENARMCRDFIAAHRASFVLAQEKYGVPPSIASALLFVETRLGKVLGDVPENAFYTLASMAVSRTPASISTWLDKLPGYEQHMEWLESTMNKRADWAYAETLALVRHMLRDGIEPVHLPGSIYGAVGLCQFMPSNISVYGEDGDANGSIDLFTVPDAVASLAKYLAKHGWRPGLSYNRQHKVLMTYNHSTTYAYTILDLGRLIDEQSRATPSRGTAVKRHG